MTAKSVDPSVHMMVQVCFCIQFAKIIPNTTGVFFFKSHEINPDRLPDFRHG